METETLQRALERAGLTGYQAEAYLALLDLGTAPAVDIAKESSVPTSQIYKVLSDLEDRGYVETIDREQIHARPRDPVKILDDLRSYSEELGGAADEIEERWKEPSEEEHEMGVVKHQSTIYERVRASIADAEHAVELAMTPDQLEMLVPALQGAHESGVLVRLSVYTNSLTESDIEALSFDGAAIEARSCDIPGPFLAVIDRKRTYFAPNDRSREPYGIIINDSILSFIFHWYFQTCLWSVHDQLYTAQEGPLPYISIEEFVQDFFTLWRDGVNISVTVDGWDNNDQRMRRVSGDVIDITFPSATTDSGRPSLEQLAGFTTVTIAVDDEPYTVGGWGAVFEDMEAYELVVTDIRFDNLSTTEDPEMDTPLST